MIKFEVGPAVKARTERSVFVTFPYNPDFVSRVKSVPIRYWDPDKKRWEVPFPLLDDLQMAFQGIAIDYAQAVKEAKKEETKQRLQKVTLTATHIFKTKPFAHQIEAINFGLVHEKWLLADEQGLGKTLTAINLALIKKQEIKHCLVVCCVAGNVWNWLKEIELHSDETVCLLGAKEKRDGTLALGSNADKLQDLQNLNDFFLVTNVESLRDKKIAAKLKTLTTNGQIGMCVIDEFTHGVKNPNSQQGKAIHNIQCKYRLAMTGTPVVNRAIDAYNALKWLDVERSSFYAFRNYFCVMGGYGGYQIVGYRHLDQLQNKIKSVMVRRLKQDTLDLPEKMRVTEYVELTLRQKQLYDEIRDMIAAHLDEIELNDNPLAEILRLRQVTSHSEILSRDICESAKFDRLKELVEDVVDSGQKLIVFSNWSSVTDLLRRDFKQYNPAVVTGQIKDRFPEVNKFQQDKDCHMMIGTIGALGKGFTLTAAQNVVFIDRPWSMADVEQAEDRAHRIGQTGTVTVYSLVAKRTVDERVEQILKEKGNLAQMMIGVNRRNFLQKLLS